MPTYTIMTTDDQDAALVYAFEHQFVPPVPPGMSEPPPPPATAEAFLQQQVEALVYAPLMQRYGRDVSIAVQQSLLSVPSGNQQAALDSIKQVITDSGGTVIEPGEPVPPVTDPTQRQHTIPWVAAPWNVSLKPEAKA